MPLKPYLEKHFSHTKKSISELSKNSKGKSLVESDKMLYCFDDISTSFFKAGHEPKTTDAIIVQNNILYFIEFKGGFHRKITRDNFDDRIATCKHCKTITCEHFKEYFLQNANKEVETLKVALKLKLVETYNILEKFICLKNGLDRESIQVRLICVADMSSDEFAQSPDKQTAELHKFKKSLSRFYNKKDASNKKYLYDHIEVLTPDTFEQLINAGHIPALP